jgi:hypothetical protein
MTNKSRNSFRPTVEMLEDRLTPAVTWHGGSVLTHVVAENLYLGHDWYQAGGIQTARYLQGFTSTLVNSNYMDDLTRAGYGVGRGSTWAGSILNYTINKQFCLADWQIQACIQQSIYNRVAAQPGGNSLYVVFVEPGVAVQDGSGATSMPGGGFLGYHSFFLGRNIYGQQVYIPYAVIPCPGGVNGAPQMYGYPNAAAELTDVASHEIAESVTDPHLNGWYDDRLGEVGDITVSFHQYLNGYYVQLISNRADQAMIVSSGPYYYDSSTGVIQVGSYDAQPARAHDLSATFAARTTKSAHHEALDVLFAEGASGIGL